jgi:hypothetical protein
MDQKELDKMERLKVARRSLGTSLFLVAQVARTLRELVPDLEISTLYRKLNLGEEVSPEEEALAKQEGAIQIKLQKILCQLGSGHAGERLKALIVECEALREEIRAAGIRAIGYGEENHGIQEVQNGKGPEAHHQAEKARGGIA